MTGFPSGQGRSTRKLSKEPFQIVDASTGKTIPEILVIPLYSSYKGIFAPEGPSKAIVRSYLDNPLFIVPVRHSR